MTASAITYEDIHSYSVQLAAKLKAAGVKPDYIVAPSRGGLLPGVILSHQLGVPLTPIQWSTRDHEERVYYFSIGEDLADGKTIVFVDDINDTGRTILELIEDWNYDEETAGKLIITSLYERYTTARKSDYTVCLVTDDTFLDFPWEAIKSDV